MTLFELVDKYGTDKTLSGYTYTYSELFTPIKDKVTSVLEIGLGTMLPEIPSTFAGNKRLFNHYKPGGSLRVWRDFFSHAKIYGIDIAEDCMFKEERIKTFLFDSSESEKCKSELHNLDFDIIIDDGNHDPKYQIRTLRNLLPLLNENGFYIIEDLGGYPGHEELLIDYLEEFNELISNYEVINKGNHIIIHKIKVKNFSENDITVVTGLWNIGKSNRSFDHYLDSFKQLLQTDVNLFIFIPKELEDFIWQHRSKHNTHIKIFELSDIRQLFNPFWVRVQNIRTDSKWLNQVGWLAESPQASLEWYNPIVMSKMFLLHDVSIWNPFNSDKFIWIDAGITNTVNSSLLINDRFFDHLKNYIDPFLFISYSYPYYNKGVNEIHGFDWNTLNNYAGGTVEWICRGGLFGGKKDAIREVNSLYWHLLDYSLKNGYMGTEESIFSILAYKYPELCRISKININGHIEEFVRKAIDKTAELEPIINTSKVAINKYLDTSKLKMSIYILTFNFPEQLEHTIQTWLKHDKWLTQTRNILIDNSTNEEARIKNKEICDKYNFEHVITYENTGINGGRFRAAKHFQESDSDYYLFLEDDMEIYEPIDGFCRNGFRTYVPNLYDKVLKILHGSNIDFLKLSFTEVYMDNNIQVSWYNVPQQIRSEFWPNYDKLPVTGLDPNCPRTKFEKIEVVDNLSYITGEIYYCNWPTITGKKGNQKMFLDTTWERPYEQTWMSYIFQETRKGNIKPAVLLASPINHNRIAHYSPEDRREN